MWAWNRWLRAAAGSLVLLGVAVAQPAGAAGALEFAKMRPSADATRLIEWVTGSGDHRGRPFAVVDKRAARIHVFDRSGRLAGTSPVLLGQTWGDDTVPGVGERAQSGQVGEDERTTPAGRFDAAPGRNLSGEHVVWADYASAFAIHRLRPGRSFAARATRLASDSPEDNRASLGCVVVPVAFYEQVVEPVLGASRSVVYVLPESRPLGALFGALQQL